jgi:hypothetical protein
VGVSAEFLKNFEDFILTNNVFPNTPKYASFAFTKKNSLRKIFSKISACLKII